MTSRLCVLLTGGTGFIGRHCIEPLLRRGATVHLLGGSAPGNALPDGVYFHSVDLLDQAAVSEIVNKAEATHLLHLAWYTVPGAYWSDPINLRWISASLSLIDAFHRAGGRRATIAGTCAEYDWRHHTFDEFSTPLDPATLYGKAKVHLHDLLRGAAFADLSLSWGRIFFPFGPGERSGRLISDVVAALLAGEPVPCSDGKQMRDFIHVADAAEAFVQLLLGPVEGPVNIASGTCRSVRSVVEDFAQKLGRPDLPQFGAKPRPANDPPYMAASVDRLLNEVAFVPAFGWDEAIEDTIDWWRNKSARGA